MAVDLQKVLIKPSDLAGLKGDNLIIFKVNNENPVENFVNVVRKIVTACTGKDTTQEPQNINEIPTTSTSITTTIDDVYIIEMQGEYGEVEFNHERLMGMKCSNYFTALQDGKRWHERCQYDEKSGELKKLIEGSKLLGFEGSYTEFASESLEKGQVKLGFGALMRSLINLFKEETKSVTDFLTVCVNLFEPPRYHILAHEIVMYPYGHGFLSKGLALLLNRWKKLSKSIIDCQKDNKKSFVMKIDEILVQVYLADGRLGYVSFTEIRNGDVHKLVGMAKC